jgi:hypothetical protein
VERTLEEKRTVVLLRPMRTVFLSELMSWSENRNTCVAAAVVRTPEFSPTRGKGRT